MAAEKLAVLRLFAGLAVPEAARQNLAAALARWRGQYPEGRWDEAQARHVTLQFIGSFPATRLPELAAALATVVWRPLRLVCAGLGAFPHPRRPRVVWAGIEKSRELEDLARAVAASLAALGWQREERPFTPHISLARPRSPVAVRGLDFAPGRPVWGSGEAAEFHLYQTLADALRSERYRVLRTFAASQSR